MNILKEQVQNVQTRQKILKKLKKTEFLNCAFIDHF